MVGGYMEDLTNHRTVNTGGWALAWGWALAGDNTVQRSSTIWYIMAMWLHSVVVMLHGVGILRLSTLSSECSYLLPSVHMTSSVPSYQRVIIHSVTSHKGYNWHSVRYRVLFLIPSVDKSCILFHCIEEDLKTQRFPHWGLLIHCNEKGKTAWR